MSPPSNVRVPKDSHGSHQRVLALGDPIRITKVDARGGTGGDPFDDVDEMNTVIGKEILKIIKVVVRFGSLVNALDVTYLLEDGAEYEIRHGGGGGRAQTISFTDRALVRVDVRHGSLVDAITFFASDGSQFGPYGGGGGSVTTFSVSSSAILAFHGREGSHIDSIGVYYQANAIDRIVINGPPEFNTMPFVETLAGAFDNTVASSLEFDNCGGNQEQTGKRSSIRL